MNSLFNDTGNKENVPLYCRMLRLVGELKRHDLAFHLKAAQTHDDNDVKFWASRSSLLLGDATALNIMEPYVLATNTHQLKAIDIALRCQPQTHTWDWINTLVKTPEQTAQTIIAIATLGDPYGVNWLLARMEEPRHAKIAGYAFSVMTGIDLLQERLAKHRILNIEEDDAEEEISAIDGYEDLPIPQVEKVSERWQQIRHQFNAGYRYFLGQPITSHLIQQTILNGNQGQRLSACTELAVLDKTNPYPNAKATLPQQGTV